MCKWSQGFCWAQEVLKNHDAYRLSTYLYKDGERGRLSMGPLWDMDMSLGSRPLAMYTDDAAAAQRTHYLTHEGWMYAYQVHLCDQRWCCCCLTPAPPFSIQHRSEVENWGGG